MPDHPRLLHLYGQECWHDNAYLVGNRAALEALHTALGRLLAGGKPAEEVQVEAADGEGYNLYALLWDHPANSSEWDELRRPYTAEMTLDRRKGARYPEWVVLEVNRDV